MIKLIKRIYRGACWSEKYGDHPGTPVMVGMILIGALAGASNESLSAFNGLIFGGVFMAAFVVPLWLIGCYGRGE